MADLPALNTNYIPAIQLDIPNALAQNYKLNQMRQDTNTQNALADAVPMLQSDPQNAFSTAAAKSPQAALQLLPIINQMDDRKKAQANDRADAFGKLAYSLKTQYPDPAVRRAVALSQAPNLAQHGVTADQLAGFDYSDNNLQLTVNNMQNVKDLIAQSNSDRTYEAGRSDHADAMNNDKANRAVTMRGQDMTDARLKQSNQILSENNPVVQSWVEAVKSGNATMQQVPVAYRNSTAMALKDAPASVYSPLAASRNTMAANRIVQNYIKLPQYELTANGLPYLQRIDAALKVPGSVSDQDLLDSLTKLNTAGNAVTDAQVKIITDGKSLGDWAGVLSNKLGNGGVLSDNQRKQIKEIANNVYQNYKKGYQPVYDQATAQLRSSGIPEAFWTIPDLNKLNAGQSDVLNPPPPAGAAPGGPAKIQGDDDYNKLPSGSLFIGPDGKTRKKP